MKALNLILLALSLALIGSMGTAVLTEHFLSRDVAMPITLTISLLLGLSARRLTEKALGYTLLDAMKEGEEK